MLAYGFLSFVLAFFNKALFQYAQFNFCLFIIFSQLIFILITFRIFSYVNWIQLPNLNQNELVTFIIPSIFYCLTTVLSLEALMKLNVAIYIVIKVK